MKNKKRNIIDIVLPNKKINYFVIFVIVLGIISGSIFMTILSDTDKSSVVEQIKLFISTISDNSMNSGLAIKNSLIINYIFVVLIWILGFSIIGIIINIFMAYIKGFILGFSLAGLIATYKIKAIPLCFLYIFPHQLLNLIAVTMVTIYSIMISFNLIKIIVSKKGNNRLMLKKYLVIFCIVMIISFISSLLEVYLFPNLLKLIIGIYK